MQDVIVEEPVADVNVPNRAARRWFVFATTIPTMLMCQYLAFKGVEGPMAAAFMSQGFNFLTIMGVTYLGTHSLDRSGILDRLKGGAS